MSRLHHIIVSKEMLLPLEFRLNQSNIDLSALTFTNCISGMNHLRISWSAGVETWA